MVSVWRLPRRQDDQWNEAPGLLRDLGDLWIALDQGAVEALALLPGRLAGNNVDRLGPDLDRDIGVRLEVVDTSRGWSGLRRSLPKGSSARRRSGRRRG